MKNINKKAVFYGYLTFFVPSFILIFVGLDIAFIGFALMILGGYITAKIAAHHEIKNAIALGCVAFAFSFLTVVIMHASTEQNYDASNLTYEIFILSFFSLSAPLLGGVLRVIEKKKRAT